MARRTFYDDRNEILRYNTVGAIIELFDECYKMGVRHAHMVDDKEEVEEFVREHRQNSHYALITGTDSLGRKTGVTVYSLHDWRLKLQIMVSTRATSTRRNTIDKYIYIVTTDANYLGAVYDMCMDFYMQGMIHYVESERRGDILAFDAKRHADYESGTVRRTDDYIRSIQLFCSDRTSMLLSQSYAAQKYMNRSKYDMFATAMANLVAGRRAAVNEIKTIFNKDIKPFDNEPLKVHEIDLSDFDDEEEKEMKTSDDYKKFFEE
jgi:predicted RNase H-related nuclease YkuK (DUF458 family)